MKIDKSTRLIEPSTGKYPVYLTYVRGQNPNMSIASNPTRACLVSLGFYPVHPTPKPNADVVTEGPPEFRDDGDYYQFWIGREYTEAERDAELMRRKEQLRVAANEMRDREIRAGVKYPFPNGEIETIPLQIDDQTILITRRMLATEVMMAGIEQDLVYRTIENNIHILTAQQIVDMTNYVLQHHEQLVVNSWTYKDTMMACERLEDLPPLPDTFIPSID